MTAVGRWPWAPLLLLLGACAVHAPPRFEASALPRAYEGRYYWAEQATTCGYRVVLAIDAATPDADGTIAVHGSVHYDPGDDQMAVDGRIDPATLGVRLRESAPNHADAEVDGAFEGALSPDLASLVAIWRTTGGGRLGVLVLRAQRAPQ